MAVTTTVRGSPCCGVTFTNGPVADVCILHTMNDPSKGHKGITAFVLPWLAETPSAGPTAAEIFARFGLPAGLP